MITSDYCQNMARYNAWQNGQLRDPLARLTDEAAELDRGAFFGSIRATLSHLLWADTFWMSRFDGGSGVTTPMAESPQFVTSLADWQVARDALDQRITLWARDLSDERLAEDLTWWSGLFGREVTVAMGPAVVHFFNHQTHHRGQVHAMLTAAGQAAPVSDLFLMPEPKPEKSTPDKSGPDKSVPET